MIPKEFFNNQSEPDFVMARFKTNKDLRFPGLLFIDLRLLRYRFSETLLSVIGIALAVGVISIIFSVVLTFKSVLGSFINSSTLKVIIVDSLKNDYNPKIPLMKINNKQSRNPIRFELKDIERVKSECPDIQYGYLATDESLKIEAVRQGGITLFSSLYSGFDDKILCHGVSPDYFMAHELSLEKGSLFYNQDLVSKIPVILLGHELNRKLFPDIDALGSRIKLNGQYYEVIGIFARLSNQSENRHSLDQDAFIPLTVLESNSPFNFQITFIARDTHRMESALKQLARYLKLRYGQRNFSIQSSWLWIEEQFKNYNPLLNLFLFFGMACLLIASLNILNVMTIRIFKQSKNMGILMSLGASRIVVLKLFLFESSLLCVSGSLLGGIFAFFLSGFVNRFIHLMNVDNVLPIKINPAILLLSILFTLFINLVFGLIPAYRVSRRPAIDIIKAV